MTREDCRLAVFLVVLGAYFSWLTIYRINNFLTLCPVDTAENSQTIMMAWRGQPPVQTLIETADGKGWNDLSFHSHFFLFLFGPFITSGHFLLLLKAWLLILSAVPIWLVCRQLDPPTRWLIVMAYVFSAFFRGQMAMETHLGAYAVVFLTLGYYAYATEKLWLFCLSGFLAFTCKENYALVFAAWGLVAIAEGRSTRWWVSIMLVTLIPLFLYLKFRPAYGVDTWSKYFGGYGNSALSCIWGMLTHPGQVLQQFFTPAKWWYAGYVAFPFFTFLFACPRWLFLSLPSLGLVFMMTVRGTGDANEIYHPGMVDYFIEAAVFSFLAFVDVVRKHDGWRMFYAGVLTLIYVVAVSLGTPSEYAMTYNGISRAAMPAISMFMLLPALVFLIDEQQRVRPMMLVTIGLSALFQATVWLSNPLCVESYSFNLTKEWQDRSRIAREMLDTIPKRASLSVQSKYAAYVARPELRIWNGHKPLAQEWWVRFGLPEYVFIDTLNWNTLMDMSVPWDRNNARLPPPWRLLDARQGLYLYRRDDYFPTP